MEALTAMPAGELARAIAAGEISAVEAVDAHLARIEATHARLNAVVVRRDDAARAEARAADEARARGTPLGPLHGVPITIKECLDLTGTPSTFGLPSRAGMLASEDAQAVVSLRQAGAIILGKTNASQLLLYNESDNPVYGRTNNPWDVERTPGGSSGGQAAVIAAGGSPLGLGTDIGGSVRAPATFTGIVSMKPTAGRVPDPGRYSMPQGQRAITSQIGVLARTVADVDLGLGIINGGRAGAGDLPKALGDPADVDVSALRVCYYTDDGTFAVSPAVRRAVREAAGYLAGRGAQVTEWAPFEAGRGSDLFFGALSADGGVTLRTVLRGEKRDPRIAQLVTLAWLPRPSVVALAAVLRAAGQRGQARVLANFGNQGVAHYWALSEAVLDYRRAFLAAMDRDAGGPFDVIICPACALPALRHGASAEVVTSGAYATLYNVLGFPAGVVPVTQVRAGEELAKRSRLDAMERAATRTEQGSVGLPVGVQVVARPWREHVALAAMHAIEEAVGPFPRPPDH